MNLVINKFFVNGGDDLFKKVKKNIKVTKHNTFDNADASYLAFFMAYKAFLDFTKFAPNVAKFVNPVKRYEYRVETLSDTFFGDTNVKKLINLLNRCGAEGWSLKVAFTNELGKRAISAVVQNTGINLNSTSDQTV